MVMCNNRFKELNPDLAKILEPGITFEQMLRDNIANNRIVLAHGDEEVFVAERMERHRNPTKPLVQKRSYGRWLELREEKMPDGSIFLINTDITERMNAQEALRDSEERFRVITEASPMPIWIIRKGDGTILFANPIAGPTLGTSSHALVGKPITDFYADASTREGRITKLEKTGFVRDDEFEMRKVDGTIIWTLHSLQNVSFQGEEAILGAFVDITERKRVEEELSRTKSQLVDAIESISQGFVLYDAGERLIICNSNYKKLYPAAAHKMVPGAKFEDIILAAAQAGQFPEAIGRIEQWVEERLVQFRYSGEPEERRFADGRWLLHSERKTTEGGTVGIRADISHLKNTEEALAKSEARSRDFATSASDWFWEMDENLRFTFISERFDEVTGVAGKRFLGKTRGETDIPDLDEKNWRQHLDDLDAHREFRDFVFSRANVHGKTVWFSINGIPVVDADGQFSGYRGTGSDITERVQAEHALRQSENRAGMANRAKSEFLANMSHELRTPLNAIIGFSEIIKSSAVEPNSSEKTREYANDIHASGQHLLELINDILDLSKIELGSEEPRSNEVDVPRLIDYVLLLLKERAHAAKVQIRTVFQDDLPLLSADELKLKQILINLMSNSIKFTPAGGQVTLDIQCHPEQGYVFEVSDTGIGIAPEDIATALQPFGQIDNALNRKHTGTGLGLPLAIELSEMHGGSLDLRSEPGLGTMVTVHFPAERVIQAIQGKEVA